MATSTSTSTYTPEQYYYKVENMVMSSCSIVRKIFQGRWKQLTGNDWEHTEDQVKVFKEGLGKDAWKEIKKKKIQKEQLITGCLDLWDLTTFSMVLNKLGDMDEYKNDNDTVLGLTKIRNESAHDSNKRVSEKEYYEKIETFRKHLRALAVNDSAIDKMIEKAGITSSVEALKATKILYEKAEAHMTNGELFKALERFDEAILMPSLLPVHEAVAHEKRAECFLKLTAQNNEQTQKDHGSMDFYGKALEDATTALELNDNSWKANHLVAQCHRATSGFELALQHYRKALAISPVQKYVKDEADSCKALLSFCAQLEYTPMEVKERISHFVTESGRQLLTEEHFNQERIRLQDSTINGKEDVFRGTEYAMGWSSVQQNDEEAARYLAKADKVGNPHGTCNLGLCYSRGKGVAQDIAKAYQLFKKAAQMSPDFPGILTKTGKNVGVASAQHCLGLMYENGIMEVLVNQDLFEAMMWYMKAAENGIGNAATNLALMYEHGLGVPQNGKKAEFYWKQGVELNDPYAAEALVGYYIKQMEPKLAKEIFEKGKKLGSTGLKGVSDEELNNVIEKRMKEFLNKDEMIEYETEQKLDVEGMTYFERVQRYQFTKDEEYQKLISDLQGLHFKNRWGGEIISINEKILEQIARLAYQGSPVAEEVLRAMRSNLELAKLLENENSIKEEDALNVIYDCITLHLNTGTDLIFPDADGKTKLKKLISQLFDKYEKMKNEHNMKSRFSFAFFNQKSRGAVKSEDTYMFDLLKQGTGMYSENVHYYLSLSNLYSISGNHKEALAYANKGLEKFPENENLMYYEAYQRIRMLPEHDLKGSQNLGTLSESDITKTTDAYKKYLMKANQHRRLSEAYYSLAYLQVLEFESQGQAQKSNNTEERKSSMLRKMGFYYNLGKEAEENMLPCYLPHAEFKYKTFVEEMLASSKSLLEQENSQQSNGPASSQPAPEPTINDGILERKPYLASPERKREILEHRQRISLLRSMTNPDHVTVLGLIQNPKLTHKAPRRMGRMRSITLKEMTVTSSDHIYDENMIDLTIIEDPFFDSQFVHILAEDENKDITRLDIYNFKPNKVNNGKLESGCRIAILNPYTWMKSQEGGSRDGIRADEPKCIIYLGKQIHNFCRFCGEENKASVKCSLCKKPLYCSKECRTHDRKIMGHDFICI